eukprot:scaffold1945_cov204-Pinguiococcus_pyrenoidosus.AAC.3
MCLVVCGRCVYYANKVLSEIRQVKPRRVASPQEEPKRNQADDTTKPSDAVGASSTAPRPSVSSKRELGEIFYLDETASGISLGNTHPAAAAAAASEATRKRGEAIKRISNLRRLIIFVAVLASIPAYVGSIIELMRLQRCWDWIDIDMTPTRIATTAAVELFVASVLYHHTEKWWKQDLRRCCEGLVMYLYNCWR